MRWKTCCIPSCGKPSMVRFTREERDPDGRVRSRRRRYLCGQHAHLLEKSMAEHAELLTLAHPEAV